MAKRIEVRAIKKATFEGDQWEPVFPANERVLLQDGLAVVPQAEEGEYD